jgi:hypothetical protein
MLIDQIRSIDVDYVVGDPVDYLTRNQVAEVELAVSSINRDDGRESASAPGEIGDLTPVGDLVDNFGKPVADVSDGQLVNVLRHNYKRTTRTGRTLLAVR